jgi:hypothetical protein
MLSHSNGSVAHGWCKLTTTWSKITLTYSTEGRPELGEAKYFR